jgi:alpha-L-rhamnosidase
MSTLIPTHLLCEYLENPLGIDVREPRLSWRIECGDAARKNVAQKAYQIVVTRGLRQNVWDSGKVRSVETTHIAYAGKPLESAARYHWKVRVWDEKNVASAWSESAHWGMGLLQRLEWKGQWIGEALDKPWSETESLPSPLLRKSFIVGKEVKQAVMYVSALGLYDLHLNGQRIGDHLLAPEWTDYHRRVQYQAYDVTAALRKGENAIGAILGQGWYAGRTGLGGFQVTGGIRGLYGRFMRLFAELHIELADGTKQVILTDPTWRYTTEGAIRGSDLMDGETYDARREIPGWDRPGFNDSSWKTVRIGMGPSLVFQRNEPIRITRTLKPVALTEPERGTYIFDLGQNMVGWARMKLRAPAGTDIRFRFGEMLKEDGTLYRDNLRIPPVTPEGAPQEDHYICKGGGVETFEPHFTYHGFRYVEVAGLPARPKSDDLTGCVFHSAADEVSEWKTSSDLLNRIMKAIRWTLLGNLHSTPTDCPQRDERLGWMGDIQVFAQTACFHLGLGAFFTKWLQDVRDAQTDDGRFPDFAPQPYDPNMRFSANPGWGDAGVIVPWRAYVNYGDKRLLEDNFGAGTRWIEFIHRHNPHLIWENHLGSTDFIYGDWLNGDTFIGLPNWPKTGGKVANEIYATAFFAYSTEIIARMATVLGKKAEAAKYEALAKKIRKAFNDAFVSKTGKIKGDTQAGYALALNFDLLPAKLRPAAARHLVAALKPYKGSMSTGIQSTVRMMLELTRCGESEAAYKLINQTTMPSWGYMVENGGTTVWERWDGWVEGRGFQSSTMNSFNHYAIGAVGEWMWRVIIGLNPDEAVPGWKHFIVKPIPGGGLTSARGDYRSMHGTIRVAWQIEEGRFKLEVTVPCNTTATVQLPGRSGKGQRVGSGTHHFESALEA